MSTTFYSHGLYLPSDSESLSVRFRVNLLLFKPKISLVLLHNTIYLHIYNTIYYIVHNSVSFWLPLIG